MKVIDNYISKKMTEAIELILGKELLDSNPVVAGGFPLFLYKALSREFRLVGRTSSFAYKQGGYSEEELNYISMDNYSYLSENLRVDSNLQLNYKVIEGENQGDINKFFNDIDLFFIEKPSEYSLTRELMSLANDSSSSNKAKVIKDLFIFKYKSEYALSYLRANTSEQFDIANEFKNDICSLVDSDAMFKSIVSQSLLNSELTIQLIRKEYHSIENIFENFDVINCCIAWHKGKLYVHDDLFKSFKSEILLSNLNYKLNEKENDMHSDIFQANRFIKYFTRYNLNPDEEIFKYIFNLYMKCKDVESSEFQYSKDEYKTYYGNTAYKVNDVFNNFHNFINYFSTFIRCSKFRDELLYFFINSKNLQAEHYIRLLEPNKELSLDELINF
tara:strand:- start:3001 stop:4164 length:1164 start_codon:yes stop_codon:yes gene_type:complete